MTTFSFLGKTYQVDRVVGHLVGESEGPIVVFVGGMHGNEPTGVIALQRAFSLLKEGQVPLRGEVLALAGNLGALAAGKRFLDHDLNRTWLHGTNGQLLKAESREGLESPEQREQYDLLQILQPILESDRPAVIIDLHTTSAPSVPFVVVNDQITNRRLALHFPVPKVLGIEEYLVGPLLSHVNEYGHTALAYESGQHDDWESCENHLAFVMLALVHTGVVSRSELPRFDEYQLRLENQCKTTHGVYEVIFREEIDEADEFVMNPGYQNFSPVRKNEVLAHNRKGPIKSPFRGRLFMPLYQSSGSEGFYLVRSVPFWALNLSAFLRRWNFETLLTWLPGVSRASGQVDALIVNRRIARFLATQFFHLLGYRRKKTIGERIIFSRREIR